MVKRITSIPMTGTSALTLRISAHAHRRPCLPRPYGRRPLPLGAGGVSSSEKHWL
jgi:hypothetical protein